MPSLGKELMLKELTAALRDKNYIFFTRQQGLSAPDFVELRRKLEKVADRTLVTKNSIARLVFRQMGVEDINGLIKGSLILTVAQKDPQVISKVLLDFSKGRDGFEMDGAYLDGNVVRTEYLKSLANLPSREVLLTTVVCGLNAPISGFVNVLGQLVRSVAIALNEIQKQKAGASA